MLRKCKAGNPPRPAYFHGWFQFGNIEGGMDAGALVEFEDGTTDYHSPGYITFDTPPNSEQGEAVQTSHNTEYVAALFCELDSMPKFEDLSFKDKSVVITEHRLNSVIKKLAEQHITQYVAHKTE